MVERLGCFISEYRYDAGVLSIALLLFFPLEFLFIKLAKRHPPNIYSTDSYVTIFTLSLALGLVLGFQEAILDNIEKASLPYIIVLSTTLSTIIYLLFRTILPPILETRRLQKLYLENYVQLVKP